MTEFDHFVGTRAVSETQAFDEVALTDYLNRHLVGFKGPLTVEIFKGGQSNPTYKLMTPQRAYVMRAKPKNTNRKQFEKDKHRQTVAL